MDLQLNLSSFSTNKNSVDSAKIYDVIIIGGGPAAMNAALYSARKKMSLAMICGEIGGQIIQSHSIENWLGDPNLKSSNLSNRFYDHVQQYDVPILQNTKVTALDMDAPIKKIVCANGSTYQAKAVIVATGKSPRPLGVPGEEEFIGRGVAYCTTCDGPVFQDKKVVVVGGGNSGVEAAIDMLSYASEVVVVQNLDTLTADEVLVDRVLSDDRISVICSSTCLRIEGSDKVERLVIQGCDGKEQSIVTDAVFVEIGLLPASDFVPVSVKNKIGEIEINADCSTSVAGLFAAGDVTTVPFKQVVIAAGEGAKAALAVYNYIISQ